MYKRIITFDIILLLLFLPGLTLTTFILEKKVIPNIYLPKRDYRIVLDFHDPSHLDTDYFMTTVNDVNGDVNSLTPMGFTFFEVVCLTYFEDNSLPIRKLTKILHVRGADIDVIGKSKKTPFYLMTLYTLYSEEIFNKKTDRRTKLKILELFLELGANPFINDENNINAVDLILSAEDIDLVNLLMKYKWLPPH